MPLVKTPEDMVASVLELAGLTEASSDLLLDLGSVAAPKKCFNDLESWAKLFFCFHVQFLSCDVQLWRWTGLSRCCTHLPRRQSRGN